jgi:type III restriction enzyme
VTDRFFEQPILVSPYHEPGQHWELDPSGQPTGRIVASRRRAEFVTPVPAPRKRRAEQASLGFEDAAGLSSAARQFDPAPLINELRQRVKAWRELPSPSQWGVTPETARLLEHWRHHPFAGVRPFFCQVEAVETLIWLTEVAPGQGAESRRFLAHLDAVNEEWNRGLSRVALKLATGAGKTTVMAMIIAWQTINAARRPGSSRFTRSFLVVTPGLTIKERLRVLQPHDPDSYYQSRELVPSDLLPELGRARIVITNYHAFKRREVQQISKVTRGLLEGRGTPLRTLETEGKTLHRVMGELLGTKGVMVLNDEAHHCYRPRPGAEDAEELRGEEKSEAESNREAARLWMSGLEIAQSKLGLTRVVDLSATPFFLRGSGEPEGTLFPWTMSDFSLLDAIECGIVKLPRVPVADNIPGEDMPVFRNLWEHIGKAMPKKGRSKAGGLDPRKLPDPLKTALQALYGHYEKTFALWQEAGISVPPCFIVVCNNTSTSKAVYDLISGFEPPKAKAEDGSAPAPFLGALPLFSNFNERGERLPLPRTLLIDSEQLEAGEALDDRFRAVAEDEIDRFRRERVERSGAHLDGEMPTDEELLREVMNTVGKVGRLGAGIRCVVSVSMLTEGWDANTVTHVLGVRAFGTQLLCEQVVGRALRRQSYELNPDGLFEVEYADVLGIPFDFTAKPVVVAPQPPRETVQVLAVSPERDACEIRFPRVVGYQRQLPAERIEARFTADSTLRLTPDLIGPTTTRNEGLLGEGVDLTLDHTAEKRLNTVLYHLTAKLLERWREPGQEPKLHLFGQLKGIARQWLEAHLVCSGGTFPAQLLLYESLTERACERIVQAIEAVPDAERPTLALLDPFNPEGSTRHVRFATSKRTRWQTAPNRCHVNWVVCDSDWEAELARVLEASPHVRAYVKNQGLGLEVPYRSGAEARRYLPDFVAVVDDGQGPANPLHLVVEVKGYRGEDAKEKKLAMEGSWVPAVNRLGRFGRWDFVELVDVWEMQKELDAKVAALVAAGAARKVG